MSWRLASSRPEGEGPFTFVSIVWANTSSVMGSGMMPTSAMTPALLTRTSTRPNASQEAAFAATLRYAADEALNHLNDLAFVVPKDGLRKHDADHLAIVEAPPEQASVGGQQGPYAIDGSAAVPDRQPRRP